MAETNLGRIVGSRIYTGTQPSTALDGDIYINTSGEMYVYDGSTSKWTDYASLKGESGASVLYYYHIGHFTCESNTHVYITYITTASSALTIGNLFEYFGTSMLPAAQGATVLGNGDVAPIIEAALINSSSLEIGVAEAAGVIPVNLAISSYGETVHVLV